jgi:acetylornithine deacetylase/succinyl-diaminopimelate desuccinylase-like protein
MDVFTYNQADEAMAHIELLSDLVRIDSVNPDLVPGGAGEAEIARYVAHWMERAGLDVEVDEAAPGRLSVVGVARGLGGGRSLMLNAHMDTVGAAGMENPHTPTIENGRLYGRGAYDMKGSLASILLAGAACCGRGLSGDVIVTAVCDEENASLGTSSILKRWSADAAVVTEPTGLDVCVAHKGFIWFEVESVGIAAHGSKPDLGVDAIAALGPVLVGVGELDRALRREPRHALLGSGSIHTSIIAGGQERSSYPARCSLSIERRTVPGEIRAEAEEQIGRILALARQADARAGLSSSTGLVREPFEIATDETIVQMLIQHVERSTGSRPRIYGDTPWMDAALISAAGIPTVVFGPGGGGAHATIEWSNLDEVLQAANILMDLAGEFCA